MCRTVGGVLVLLLALPAWGDDKPKDKPSTPKEQYQALLKEQQDAMQAFSDAYQKAKTQAEKDKVVEEKYPKPEQLAPKFLDLAEKNPKDPVAFDALVWVVTNGSSTPAGKDSPAARAVVILLRDHVQSEKLAQVCQTAANGYDEPGADLLRGILEKNPKAEVRAEACAALAQHVARKAQLARYVKEHADDVERLEKALGKEYMAELQKTDVAKVEAESARYFKEFGDKYAAQMKPDRLAQLCQSLGRSGGEAGEALLRALLDKGEQRDVQGVACLALAQALKNRADRTPEAQAKEAEKLRQESEEFFVRATDKFGDVQLGRSTVGEQAKVELYELRFLSIGKVAPEVEGEDADGKKFKLSDYRGKVVLIDFWGHW